MPINNNKKGTLIQLQDLTIIEKQNLNKFLITNRGKNIIELREYSNNIGVFLPNGLFRFIKRTQKNNIHTDIKNNEINNNNDEVNNSEQLGGDYIETLSLSEINETDNTEENESTNIMTKALKMIQNYYNYS